MVKCNNCGLEFSLWTENGFEIVFHDSEYLRKMFRVCGQCEQDSECLEWVNKRSNIADALVYASDCAEAERAKKDK
jgi:hypothetical protein